MTTGTNRTAAVGTDHIKGNKDRLAPAEDQRL
jgi:hypothetical protein